MSQQVIIFDTTLRDGEQALQASLSVKEKLQIALALERMGVDVMEVGFPVSSPGDFESVQTIARQVKNSRVCALARCVEKDIDVAAESLKVAEAFRIHTFIATSPMHIATKLRSTLDEVIERAIYMVKRARNYTDDVEFSCEDAGRTPIADLARVVEAAINAGATTINIPDTVGYTMPFEFAGIISGLYERVYEIMTPESIGLNQIQLNLTSRSGRAAVKHRMDEMGYKESEYNLDNLYDAFLKLADKKGQVFDYDLEALAFIGKQQEEPEHFRLDYFSVQSGSNDIATAAVKLACGEEVKAEAANGNGPVDAVYQAINRITDYNVELVKYSLTAKGHGKDALGQVDIVANYNGRRFHGVGLATDIVESSAKAMVHVLNNIWRAAEVEKELQRKAQHNENNKETV